MTLGSPARSTGYRYTRSTTYRRFSPDEEESAYSNETMVYTPRTNTARSEISGVGVTDFATNRSNTTLSSPDRPSLFRWNVSEVSSRSSDRRDNSGGPSTLSSSPSTPSSGAQSPVRGRALDISTLQHGLVSRRTVRRRAGPTSVEFDTTLMQARIGSRDFAAEAASLRDSALLDPISAGRDYRSASEACFGHTVHGFAGHRDTFALLVGLPKLAPELPLEFFYRLCGYISLADYLSVRLSCREWSAAISYVVPLKLPAVYFVPLEIVQHIYSYLRPVDFNAVRHTCRAWMLASLEAHLLRCMLKRGGWGDVIVDAPEHPPVNVNGGTMSLEWALSKLLARECALGPYWTGNGLRPKVFLLNPPAAWDSPETPTPQDSGSAQIAHDRPPYASPSYAGGSTALAPTARVDFSALGSGSARGNERGAAINFTVSVCGKYLLVAEGCMIFIYRLSSDKKVADDGVSAVGLTAISSIICPRRVLATSMDTSSQRFAVAALLDGRMGLVCDLDENSHYRGPRTSPRRMHHNSSGFHVSVSPSSLRSPLDRAFVRSSGSSGEREITDPAFGASSYFEPGPSSSSQHPAGSQAAPRIHDCTAGRLRSAVPGAFARDSGFGIESSPRSVYKNLCSDDDPPRSVAICPQRRCVAFGCSAGIELHWVDALTGQDLNRWFPLTAPSDFLYFLPPRRGVDSAKKLRLISSAAHPDKKPAVQHHFYPAQTVAHMLFGPLRSQYSGMQSASDCDHYRAVPLSDGKHVLFTDPVTDMLCLGNDAPLGGPTKLLRKVIMVGPEGCVPSVYAAGADLRWGVRIVVGYGDGIFLFSIPPDIFLASQSADTTEPSPDNDSWHLYHDNSLHDDGDADVDAQTGAQTQRSLWPVRIHGTEMGRVQSLSDLAIDSSPAFKIWAFSALGEAFVWEISNGSPQRMKTIWISQDGSVDAATDLDGDTIMAETPPLPVAFGEEHFESWDGAMSIECPVRAAGREGSDVEMRDADADVFGHQHAEDREFAQAGGAFAIMVPRQEARWSAESADWVPDYLKGESLDDGVLALLGVSEFECEIL